MSVRRAQADEWEALRALRLQALADTPEAFARLFADEEALSDEEWLAWAEARGARRLEL